VATNSDPVAEACRHLRNGAQARRYVHEQPVFHSRLDELQAALLRVKLPHLDSWNERRNQIYSRYRDSLPECRFPALVPGAVSAAHLAVMGHKRRDALQQHLAACGVDTLIHYPVPLHQMPAFASCRAAPCAHAEQICSELLSLPLHFSLSPDEQDYVVNSIHRFPPGA
jgi:dTDP-3-amino-3,4,6-trideoxy-alpha-D-glucose transaminase